MKNDKLLETIVRSQASNAYYRTAEQAEYDNRNLDEIAEIVKRHSGEANNKIDVVQVVRCGECELYQIDALFNRNYCRGRFRKPDDFCSDGKRKEDKQ